MSVPKYITVLAILIAASALIVLYFFDPETAGIYPVCPSKFISGYDCPGCGSLRATHALLHGNIASAWRYNPAIFFAIALLLLIGAASLHRNPFFDSKLPQNVKKTSRKIASVTDSVLFPIVILLAVIFWSVFRNL